MVATVTHVASMESSHRLAATVAVMLQQAKQHEHKERTDWQAAQSVVVNYDNAWTHLCWMCCLHACTRSDDRFCVRASLSRIESSRERPQLPRLASARRFVRMACKRRTYALMMRCMHAGRAIMTLIVSLLSALYVQIDFPSPS
jgi:hypothetical protein